MNILEFELKENKIETVLLTESQDILKVLESKGIDPEFCQDVTGVKIETYFNGLRNDCQLELTESLNPCIESDWDCIGYWM